MMISQKILYFRQHDHGGFSINALNELFLREQNMSDHALYVVFVHWDISCWVITPCF